LRRNPDNPPQRQAGAKRLIYVTNNRRQAAKRKTLKEKIPVYATRFIDSGGKEGICYLYIFLYFFMKKENYA
jgi:hypothetical protein